MSELHKRSGVNKTAHGCEIFRAADIRRARRHLDGYSEGSFSECKSRQKLRLRIIRERLQTSYIGSTLEVGEPITIFIYLKDPSNLYDIMVTDCWAYDDQDFEKANNKLHLTEEHTKR